MIKGISQQFSPSGTPKEYGFFSKNIIINKLLDEIFNEKGTKLIDAFNANDVQNILGVIVFGPKVIIFYKGLDSSDRIGVYDEDLDTYSAKISRTDLNFDPQFPITGKAKLNSKGELIIVFNDRDSTPKYINLDTALPGDSLNLYSLNLPSTNPNINISVLEGAGAFKTGAYWVAIQYLDRNKAISNASFLSDPLYIVSHTVTADYTETQGSAPGIITNKAIRVNLTELDTSFERIRVIVISKINDTVEARIYKETAINGSNLTFVLAGSELSVVLGIEEVLTSNLLFDKVDEIESLNDQLFLAGLTLPPVVDFQSVANKLVIQWTSTPYYDVIKDTAKENANDRAPYLKDGNIKTFIHDEIYAFYAQFEDPKTGRWSDWFTIPGPVLTSGERLAASEANSIKLNGVTPKKFQLNDTCFHLGNVGNILDNTSSPAGYAYGLMGSWENEDEFYPPNFPDLAGERVRHHRFPSSRYLKSEVYGYTSKHLVSMWDSLGLKVLFDQIPTDSLTTFKGIRIGFAKRDTTNMTVLGYDIAQLGAHPQNDGDATTFNTAIIASAAGNWRVAGAGIDNDIAASNNYLRIHSPDILLAKPLIEDVYLSSIHRLTLNDLDDEATGKITFGKVIWGQNDSGIFSFVSDWRYAQEQNIVGVNQRYLKLDNTKYIANNVTVPDADGNIYNLSGEEFVHAKVESTLNLDTNIDAGPYYHTDRGGSINSPGLSEETIIMAIKTLRSNVFISYKDQPVVPIGQVIRSFADPLIMNGDGDGFITYYTFVTTICTPGIGEPFPADGVGIRNIKGYIAESRFNLNQRYTDPGTINSFFFPFAGGTANPDDRLQYWYAKISQSNAAVNKWLYSKDFNAVNDLEQYGVYDHEADYTTGLPFAIARGQKASRANDIEDGWRQFKPNDIFYTVRDKGRIINLVAWGTDSLLIHHSNALFKTRDKAVLETDITKISLGTGDLFEIEPQEVAPTDEGFGGTQHKFSCMLTPAGYFFIDADVGEVFLYKGGDSYLSMGKGFYNLFKDIFKANRTVDNPINNQGITVAYDKDNNRLLLSLKAEFSFTAIFDLIKEEWDGFHDCLPDLLFNTRKNQYSFKNQSLYVHNKGRYGEYYGTVYPSFVDLIINEEPKQEKILSAIQWITRVTKDGVNKPDETITHVTIWNDYFCTGKIEVKALTNIAVYEGKNAKQVDRSWNYDDIKDAVIDPGVPFIDGLAGDYRPISGNINTELAWFEQEELRGKYFIIRLEYSNFEDKLVSLNGLSGTIKLSSR